ncbi:MAG: hypothetical protein ABI614_11480, partial [Planctomycetota bacterium]
MSNDGYAVGVTLDDKGFVWHPSFNGVDSEFNGPQIFDEWLDVKRSVGDPDLTEPVTSVVAVAEDRERDLLIFAINDGSRAASVQVRSAAFFPEPPVPYDYGDAPSAIHSGFAS